MGGYYPPRRRSSYGRYGGSHERILELLLRQGDINAESRLRGADILGQTIGNLGQIGEGALQEHGKREEQKRAVQKMAAQDAAATRAIGEWDGKDHNALLGNLIRIKGPVEGPKLAQSVAAFQQINAQADEKNLANVKLAGEGWAKTSYPMFEQGYQFLLSKAPEIEKLFGYKLPPEPSPEVHGVIKNFFGGKAGEGFTLSPGQQRFGPDGKPLAQVAPEPPKPPSLQHVETAEGIRTFNPATGEMGPVIGRGKPSQGAGLKEIETIGPDGKPVTQFVTPSPGATYPKPEKPGVTQRLTKEERQDFAAWNYALPKLDTFSRYVKANPDKWGKWDAAKQQIKQALPGFADAEYASQDAFIARMNSEIRHALFGAALTGGEQGSADAFLINRKDQPEVVVAKVLEASRRARANMDYYRGLGFNIPQAGGNIGKPPTTVGRFQVEVEE